MAWARGSVRFPAVCLAPLQNRRGRRVSVSPGPAFASRGLSQHPVVRKK